MDDDRIRELTGEVNQILTVVQGLRDDLAALEGRVQQIANELRSGASDAGGTTAAETQSGEAAVKADASAPAKQPVDPIDALQSLSRGGGLFSPRGIDGKSTELVLLLRSDDEQLGELGSEPKIEFRAGFYGQGSVGLVAILCQLGSVADENLFECWVDEHAPVSSGTLAKLSKDDSFDVYLCGDGCRIREHFTVENPLKYFAEQVHDLVAKFPKWSADDFHLARQASYRRNPTVSSMWRSLKG